MQIGSCSPSVLPQYRHETKIRKIPACNDNIFVLLWRMRAVLRILGTLAEPKFLWFSIPYSAKGP